MRRTIVRLSSFVLAMLLLGVSCASAASVTVFAAASLKEAMDELARQFRASTGDAVTVSYGASNTLARQIEAGAPADVFISADRDWMDYLAERHLIAADTRVDLLSNTLVLIAPSGSTAMLRIGHGFPLASTLGTDRLAMANPDSVPAGRYAKSALEKLGVWNSVAKRIARAENVRAALALVSRGEAPFGIVYATDALADRGVRIVDTFPADSHPPIVYPAAVIAGARSPAARALLEFLRSTAARTVWQRHGFKTAR